MAVLCCPSKYLLCALSIEAPSSYSGWHMAIPCIASQGQNPKCNSKIVITLTSQGTQNISKCDAKNHWRVKTYGTLWHSTSWQGKQQGLQAHLDDPCKNNGKALGTCFARNSLLKRIQSPEDAAASGIISSVPDRAIHGTLWMLPSTQTLDYM